MAFFDTSRPANAGQLRRAVATLFTDFAAWRDARATRTALNKLTDRELSDIGLQRSDFDEMADRGVSRF
ncbi:MAG: DUF1127 domain-containing protein [Pseudomonadota bacterium]